MKITGWYLPKQSDMINEVIKKASILVFTSYEVTTSLKEKEETLKAVCNLRDVNYYGMGDLKQHYRNAKRIEEELGILNKAGAESLIFCEMQSLINCPEISEVIKNYI